MSAFWYSNQLLRMQHHQYYLDMQSGMFFTVQPTCDDYLLRPMPRPNPSSPILSPDFQPYKSVSHVCEAYDELLKAAHIEENLEYCRSIHNVSYRIDFLITGFMNEIFAFIKKTSNTNWYFAALHLVPTTEGFEFPVWFLDLQIPVQPVTLGSFYRRVAMKLKLFCNQCPNRKWTSFKGMLEFRFALNLERDGGMIFLNFGSPEWCSTCGSKCEPHFYKNQVVTVLSDIYKTLCTFIDENIPGDRKANFSAPIVSPPHRTSHVASVC